MPAPSRQAGALLRKQHSAAATRDMQTQAGLPKKNQAALLVDALAPLAPARSADSPRSCSLEPLAVSAVEAARLCSVGKTLWHDLDSSAKIPAPIKLGARCVWVVEELRAWLNAGAPPRHNWEALKNNHGQPNRQARHCAPGAN